MKIEMGEAGGGEEETSKGEEEEEEGEKSRFLSGVEIEVKVLEKVGVVVCGGAGLLNLAKENPEGVVSASSSEKPLLEVAVVLVAIPLFS